MTTAPISKNLIQRINRLAIAFYVASGLSMFLLLCTSFGDQITQSAEIQFVPSEIDPNQLIAVQETPTWLPLVLICGFLSIIVAFVVYFIWFYNSYRFFLQNNTNIPEQKTFRKTPLGAVVIQFIPILGWILAQTMIWEISTNNSDKNHNKEAKTNIAVMMYQMSIVAGIVFRLFLRFDPSYSKYEYADLFFYYIGTIGVIYIVSKFQTGVYKNKVESKDLIQD
jgi:NADH:ubiquinone oxidoreductase subunit 5 (subunit L)/multisubunit Na+/H+ antiporter MnhA subunit